MTFGAVAAARLARLSLPSWAPLAGAALLALAGFAGGWTVNGWRLGAQVAEIKAERDNIESVRADAALAYEKEKSILGRAHAAAQQKSEEKYAKLKTDLDRRDAGRLADNARLRDKIAAYAASDRRPGETDAAALERANGRLGTVGGLLAEGVGLLEEGRGIVERQDAQLIRMAEQIRIDRAACSGSGPAPQIYD